MNIFLSPSKYLSIWIFFIFITSFVVSNVVKGTTPAFLFAIASIPITVLIAKRTGLDFIVKCAFLIILYIFFQLLSQGLLFFFNPPNFNNLIVVSEDTRVIFRISLFTQSLYLACSLITLMYVSYYYNSRIHNVYLVASLIIFTTIGFVFFLFYFLFNMNGDFISNREYSGGLINPGQFQPIVVGGVQVARFVSLTGEPSMYVYSILPFAIYTLHSGYRKTAIYLFTSLLFTLSGTFVIGLILYSLALSIFALSKRLILYIVIALIVVAVGVIINATFRDILYDIIISKLLQESDSGLDRFQSLFKHLVFFLNLPIPLMLTGMGFGFIRSPDFFSTLLVNTGFVGFFAFSILILYPAFKLPTIEGKNIGLKCALIVIYFILMTSVSEYSYPSLWFLLGISYNELGVLSQLPLMKFSR